ncbi:MAG: signal peptidase I [Nocardioides sp.]|nr:signal peptidase I [Nocardioides sp.]
MSDGTRDDAHARTRAQDQPFPSRSERRAPRGHPEEAPDVDGGKRARPKRKAMPVWQESVLLLAIALVLAVVIKAFFVQAFYIPSGSMRDTLVENDRILVQKISYWTGEAERGDIVVFADPGGWLDAHEIRTADNPASRVLELFGLFPTGGHLVKRVVGVGGDNVRCCDRRGRVVVNGVPLREQQYLFEGVRPSLIRFDIDVPDGRLWVMGDNRPNSADSRLHLGDPGGGTVAVEDVVGKVFSVVWPLGNAQVLDRPATFEDVPAAP